MPVMYLNSIDTLKVVWSELLRLAVNKPAFNSCNSLVHHIPLVALILMYYCALFSVHCSLDMQKFYMLSRPT